jgi:hypothetical protein
MDRARVAIVEAALKRVLSQFQDLYKAGGGTYYPGSSRFSDILLFRLSPIYLCRELYLSPAIEQKLNFSEPLQQWATTVQNADEDKYHIMEELRVLALALVSCPDSGRNSRSDYFRETALEVDGGNSRVEVTRVNRKRSREKSCQLFLESTL